MSCRRSMQFKYRRRHRKKPGSDELRTHICDSALYEDFIRSRNQSMGEHYILNGGAVELRRHSMHEKERQEDPTTFLSSLEREMDGQYYH
mmetsp:Transcript_15491/g.42809  ORF Transcript_15491/g.42809 Transcript_15491/m.42809 type:complete len:90 (-) Transcript_15491:141-410(-)